MLEILREFLAHWAVTALALWLASLIFHGVSFSSKKSLLISALLLGMVNAVIRPVVIILTIPLTLITFGLFLLVINAVMMLLVSALVPGFKISGFWTAFFASIVVTLISLFLSRLIFGPDASLLNIPAQQGLMV